MLTTFEHPASLAGPPIPWEQLDRLLVVRPDNLGDVLMAGPALRALREVAPTARIDLLAAPAGAGAAALMPEVDAVLEASVSWQHAGHDDVPLDRDTDLVARLARGRYDASVILTSFSQSPWPAGYLCRMAGIPIRVGTSKEFGGAGLTHWVPAPPDSLHQVDRALYLLERVGVPGKDRRLRADVPEETVARTRALLGDYGLTDTQTYAVILPGASCAARRYPPERFAAVAALLAEAGVAPVVVGTEKERELVEEVAQVPGAVPLAGVLDLLGLAAAVSGSSVVVCNNSGGMHLANAVATPLVALFAGTEEIGQYEPRFTDATVLTVEVPCSPCRQFTCPYAHECLDLPPARVARAALALSRR